MDELRLPLVLLRLPESARDHEDLERLLSEAEGIWAQAAIGFDLDHTATFFPAVTLEELLSEQRHGPIEAIAVSELNANGVSNKEARRFLIRDETTVPDGRVFAHEVGHILIDHTHPDDSQRLMASGQPGTLLTAEEIQVARVRAEQLLSAARG